MGAHFSSSTQMGAHLGAHMGALGTLEPICLLKKVRAISEAKQYVGADSDAHVHTHADADAMLNKKQATYSNG